MSGCRVCREVAESDVFYPPILSVRSRRLTTPFDQLPGSSWFSVRCETRPYGLFLLRRFSFVGVRRPAKPQRVDGDRLAWNEKRQHPVGDKLAWEEHRHYYADVRCASTPTFVVHSIGSLVVRGPSAVVDDAYDVDVTVVKVKVTVRDRRFLPGANSLCGTKNSPWAIDVEREVIVTSSSSSSSEATGCKSFCIELPTRRTDNILAVEGRKVIGGGHLHRRATQMLYFGQQPFAEDDGADPSTKRPTSFLPPLERCRDANRDGSVSPATVSPLPSRAIGRSSGGERAWRQVAVDPAAAATGAGAASRTTVRVLLTIAVVLVVKI